MRFRKPLAAVAVAGLTAGLVVISGGTANAGAPLPPAGEPVQMVLECFGDDSVRAGSLGVATPSQDILNILGQLADPPVDPPNSIEVTIEITPMVPETLDPDASSPAGFSGKSILGQALLDAAAVAGITDIQITNTEFSMLVQGGWAARSWATRRTPTSTSTRVRR